MQYDINFLNIGNSQIVDKGTTIKLPCNVDMYPGRLQITTFSAVQWYQSLSAKISKYEKQTRHGVVLIDFREQKSNFYLIYLLKSLITKLVFVRF